MMFIALLTAADARSILYVRPACHDEHAVSHIAPSEKPDTIVMAMNKVVDGKEEEIGTLEYRIKQLPKGEVIRNIRLEKR